MAAARPAIFRFIDPAGAQDALPVQKLARLPPTLAAAVALASSLFPTAAAQGELWISTDAFGGVRNVEVTDEGWQFIQELSDLPVLEVQCRRTCTGSNEATAMAQPTAAGVPGDAETTGEKEGEARKRPLSPQGAPPPSQGSSTSQLDPPGSSSSSPKRPKLEAPLPAPASAPAGDKASATAGPSHTAQKRLGARELWAALTTPSALGGQLEQSLAAVQPEALPTPAHSPSAALPPASTSQKSTFRVRVVPGLGEGPRVDFAVRPGALPRKLFEHYTAIAPPRNGQPYTFLHYGERVNPWVPVDALLSDNETEIEIEAYHDRFSPAPPRKDVKPEGLAESQRVNDDWSLDMLAPVAKELKQLLSRPRDAWTTPPTSASLRAVGLRIEAVANAALPWERDKTRMTLWEFVDSL